MLQAITVNFDCRYKYIWLGANSCLLALHPYTTDLLSISAPLTCILKLTLTSNLYTASYSKGNPIIFVKKYNYKFNYLNCGTKYVSYINILTKLYL